MARRLLLLGAAGFVGRSIAHHVAAHGGAELILHDRTADHEWGFDNVFESHTLDLLTCATGAIAELIDRASADVVVNCTGLTVGQPDELFDANVGVVSRLIDELDGRDSVHLVQIGSAAEYGIQHRRCPVSEEVLATPQSAYGITKLEATGRLMAAAERDRISVTVLRVFNPVGRFSSASTLPGNAARLIDAALCSGAPAINLGSLDSRRDYIDTRDVARAVLAAASAPPRSGVVLNVGRGEEIESRYLVKALASIAGYHGDIIEDGVHSVRSGRVESLYADVEKIKRRLGWSADYSIDDSLRDLWSAISTNREFADG